MATAAAASILSLHAGCVDTRTPQEKDRETNRKLQAAMDAQKAAEAEQKKTEIARVDAELQKFANEYVPDLQKAIEKHREQIKQFTDQRAAFATDMARLGVDPDTRPAYVRKKQHIDKMAKDVEQLVAQRRETYVRWRELSLLSDTRDTREQRDKLLASAKAAAKAADETFDKIMKQSLDLDGN